MVTIRKLTLAVVIIVAISATAILTRPMIFNPSRTANSEIGSTASSQIAYTTSQIAYTTTSSTLTTYPIAYGVNFPWYFYYQVNNKLISELHLKWIRTQIPYNLDQPDLFALMNYYHDSRFLMILAMGMMGGYQDTCKFTTSAPGATISSCDWTLSDWDAKVNQAVLDYPNTHVWEIWNEPQWFESGYLCCDDNVTKMAYHYFDMLRDAYRIIKAHNSNDLVIAFGGASLSYWHHDNWSWIWEFSQQVWKLGAGAYCDAVSLHAYTDFSYLLDNTVRGTDRSAGDFWNEALANYETLTDKPIWITETSLQSNQGQSPARQAVFLNQTFTFFSHYSYVKSVFWFAVEGNDNGDLQPVGFDLGLVTMGSLDQQTPKPAFYVFQAFSEMSVTSLDISIPWLVLETTKFSREILLS